jgi:hypothetical protein
VEALVYEMPLGLTFRKVVIWHEGRKHVFRDLRGLPQNPSELVWRFCFPNHKFPAGKVEISGRKGLIHRLPYCRTDGSGQFEVSNDSLATARMTLYTPNCAPMELSTDTGAVVETAGNF